MNLRIEPRPLAGRIKAIASKSMAHRLLICAALAPQATRILCETTSKDIEATIACVEALGAQVERDGVWLRVSPVPGQADGPATLDCSESGSTLRFMLPVAAATHRPCKLYGAGRLADRPLSPLYEELIVGGADISQPGTFPLCVGGALRAGRFELPGNVSSQYVSGLLLAAPLLDGETTVRVAEPIESRPYIDLTINALAAFGVEVTQTHEEDAAGSYTVFGVAKDSRLVSPGEVVVEGDWSNAGFWLAAGSLTGPIEVEGLDLLSKQGDRAVMAALAKLGSCVRRGGGVAVTSAGSPCGCEMDVADFPDLVPPLAAVAALAPGTTRLTGCARLRLKESDRVETVCAGLAALGASISSEGDDIVICGRDQLDGGVVDAANDHRIAMMAAIAASRCAGPVTIVGAECVQKSYPHFFEDYQALGGVVTEA